MLGNSSPPLCRGTRRDGTPCQAQAPASGWCWAHDPALAGQRREVRAKGGHGKSKAARLSRLVPPRLLPVYDRLEQALGEVHAGQLDPRRAAAMAALAGALVRVMTAGDLEQRVRRLEEERSSGNGTA